jgi:hypothetical protein
LAIEDPNARDLAQLQADWPLWEVWIVHRVVGGPVWCARCQDDHRKILNADSLDHLAEYLEDEASR